MPAPTATRPTPLSLQGFPGLLDTPKGRGRYPGGSGSHLMGTARMGTDPVSSVVDRWGRAHDVPNRKHCLSTGTRVPGYLEDGSLDRVIARGAFYRDVEDEGE